MAIAFDAKVEKVDAGVSESSSTQSFTVGSLTNGILVVATHHYAVGGATISGITWNGSALTLVVATLDQPFGPGYDNQIWYIKNPASGTHDVVITFSGSDTIYLSAGIISLSGVDQTTPIDTSTKTGIVNGTTATVTLSVVSNAWMISVVDFDNQAITGHGGGQTTIGIGALKTEESYSGPLSSGSNSHTYTTALADDWYASAVSLKPAAVSSVSRMMLMGVG